MASSLRFSLLLVTLGLLGPDHGYALGGSPEDPEPPLPPAEARADNPLLSAMLKERPQEVDSRAAGIGKRVPDLPFADFEGRRGRLSDYSDQEALVIVVRQIGCPVGDRYGPRIGKLEREFEDRGVSFLYVNMDTYVDAQEVQREELEKYGFRGRYVHDPEETFGRALGVETTTVVFVLDAARTLRYRGAVDDQIGRGVILPEARIEYLRDALESVLAHEQVSVQATRAPGCSLDIEREERDAEEITFHDQVARILQNNCVECHREGGAGPFSLESYETAYDKRRMIRLVVEEKIMPPWFAVDESGPWKNDRRLTPQDLDALLTWIENDAPEGESAEAPVPLRWNDGWVIGEPDEVFQLYEEMDLPAEGVIKWDPIDADRIVPYDMWIERLQILPGDNEVVHHVMLYFQPPPTFGKDGSDVLMEALMPWRKESPRWFLLAGYLPGSGPRIFPTGVARFLPKGSRLRFEMHYTPTGTATKDRTSVGFVLAKEEPDLVSQMLTVQNFRIKIAPNTLAEYEAEMTLPGEVLVRSLNPHLHYRGTTFEAKLTYPDGREEPWIKLPLWDPDWQFSYYFEDQPVLPAGTKISIKGYFDNTADNPINPDPSQWVYGGPQSWDEMLFMGVDCIQPRELILAREGALVSAQGQLKLGTGRIGPERVEEKP